MDAEQINKRIHEWLGKCWHEENFAHVFTIKCRHCGEVFRGWPDYTTDLNAVREAELKCIEEDGAFKYANVLSKRFREGFPNRARALMGDEQIMTLIVTASALTRAQAVFDVLEGENE